MWLHCQHVQQIVAENKSTADIFPSGIKSLNNKSSSYFFLTWKDALSAKKKSICKRRQAYEVAGD